MTGGARSEPIFHIVERERWRDALARADQSGAGSGGYTDPSLGTEGFIHCSRADQVLMPADALFAGRDDLVLLVIDPQRVPSPVVYEDCYESGNEFPHIYGPIPTDSVVAVIDFPSRPDGRFDLPDQVANWIKSPQPGDGLA